MEKVTYERRGAAAVLTITRPERRNAVDDETAGLLAEGFHHFEDDDEARALVLTGEGPEAFCAGADLKALAEAPADFAGDDPQAAVGAWLDERPTARSASPVSRLEADDRRDLGLVSRRRARARAVVRPADRHRHRGSASPNAASACR